MTLEVHICFGEGGEVEKDNPVMLQVLKQLEALIDIYDVENVYNMDEKGLFFWIVPKNTLFRSGKDVWTAWGKKVRIERVNLSVCCNATGSQNLPFLMIRKPTIPAYIVGRECPLIYHKQKKAWMNRVVFVKCFKNVFFLRFGKNR